MKIQSNVLELPDGRKARLSDVRSGIETVRVPWDKSVRGYLQKGCTVMIMSIIAPAHHVLSPTPNLGLIRFWYHDRIEFSAPLVSLRNRYHRLMYAQQIIERMRMLVHPSAKIQDLGDEDLRPLKVPFVMNECMDYEIEHKADETYLDPGADENQGIILEFDYLSIGRNRTVLWPPT